MWCVAITDDFVIITGDSRGITSFWDGKLGTVIDQVNAHKADVLCLCLSEDQQTVYTAGELIQTTCNERKLKLNYFYSKVSILLLFCLPGSLWEAVDANGSVRFKEFFTLMTFGVWPLPVRNFYPEVYITL